MSAEPTVVEREETSRWFVLVLVCLAQFMVILDATIVNVALPSIQRDLQFSAGDLQWVINSYTLTFGGFLLLGGRAADIVGRRRLFVGGTLLFTAAKRFDVLPNIPTTEEAGLPNFQVGIWHGIYAPKGTSPEVLDKLSKSLQKALKDENVIARFAELGTKPSSEADATPAALKAKLESEVARWKPVIEAAGQYAD